MTDFSTTPTAEDKQLQDNKIHKRELLTILMVCVIIGVMLGVLYYFQSNNQILTKLGDYITNHVL